MGTKSSSMLPKAMRVGSLKKGIYNPTTWFMWSGSNLLDDFIPR
jgi:hypothetical protein